jgi:hypothetical protein
VAAARRFLPGLHPRAGLFRIKKKAGAGVWNARRFAASNLPLMKNPLTLLSCLAALALAGCSTVESRIEEKAAVFNALPAETQSRIQQGLVDVGYTPDMVYIAMGKADRVIERASNNGTETVWIYNNYYQEYQGTQFAGYQRSVYYDPRIKAYRVYYQPVHADVYRDRTEEVARIVFKDGKVASIEQVKE